MTIEEMKEMEEMEKIAEEMKKNLVEHFDYKIVCFDDQYFLDTDMLSVDKNDLKNIDSILKRHGMTLETITIVNVGLEFEFVRE